MSTANFCKKNASKYYAIELKEEYDYEDIKSNLQYEFGIENKKNVCDGDRNYPGTIISNIDKQIGKWIVDIDIIIRGAYYDGANLDYDIRVLDVNSRDEYYLDDGVKFPKKVQACIDSKIKKIEKIFASYSTPLICTARFSNGEAMYQKCSN